MSDKSITQESNSEVNTSGGAYVEGAVDTGAFVGRDLNIRGDYIEGDFVARDKYHAGGNINIGLTFEQVKEIVIGLKRDGYPKVWTGDNPYPGFRSYSESEAPFFFGREALVEKLKIAVRESQFVAIVGPSGSGKSSIARAGLFYELRKDDQSDSDMALLLGEMKPGLNPIMNLAEMVADLTHLPETGKAILSTPNDPYALKKQLEIHLRNHASQHCVLLIDQFEELFTQTDGRDDENELGMFINLLTAASEEVERVTIVLTMRSDFMSNVTKYPILRDLISENLHLVGKMEAHNLARAITVPALKVGVEIENDLVFEIVNELEDPGALPLVNFVLRDLFQYESEKRRSGDEMTLTLKRYNERGGVKGALSKHANDVIDHFSDDEMSMVKSIFTKMVEISKRPPVVYSRKWVTFSHLVTEKFIEGDIQDVLTKLSRQDIRLITTFDTKDQDISKSLSTEHPFSLVHDKLIESWSWLYELIKINEDFIRLSGEIAQSAQKWEDENRNPGFLYETARLDLIENQVHDRIDELDLSSKEFLDASKRKSRRLRRRNRIAIGSLISITLVAILSSFIAFQASNDEAGRRIAVESRLAAESGQFNLAVLLAIEAVKRNAIDANLIWEDVFHGHYPPYRERMAIAGSSPYNDIAWDSQGKRFATYAKTRVFDEIEIWDLETRQQVSWFASEDCLPSSDCYNNQLNSIDWHPSKDWIVAGYGEFSTDKGFLAIWDVTNEKKIFQSESYDSDVMIVSWHPKEDFVAYVFGSTLVVRDFQNNQEVARFDANEKDIRSLAWHPDGELISLNVGKTILILNISKQPIEELMRIENEESSFSSIFWHPEGNSIISGSDNGIVQIWDLNGQEIDQLENPENYRNGSIAVVTWAPTGERLAYGDREKTVIWKWNGSSEKEIEEIIDYPEGVIDAAWAPNGKQLAIASDGEIGFSGGITRFDYIRDIRLWVLNIDNNIYFGELMGQDSPVTNMVWSANGQYLASATDDRIQIWDVFGGVIEAQFATRNATTENLTTTVNLEWLSDDTKLAAVFVDKSISIYEMNTELEELHVKAPDDSFDTVAISEEGKQLIFTSFMTTTGADDLTHIYPTFQHANTGSVIEFVDTKRTNAYIPSDWNPNLGYIAFGPLDIYNEFGSNYEPSIQIWDMDNARRVDSFSGHETGIRHLKWSPQGNLLASSEDSRGWGYYDKDTFSQLSSKRFNTLRVWNIENGREQISIDFGALDELADKFVDELVWHPNGTELASIFNDGTISFWNVKNGREIRRLQIDDYEGINSNSIAWHPSGDLFAYTTVENGVKLYMLNEEGGCNFVSANLRISEHQRYIGKELPYLGTCTNLPIIDDVSYDSSNPMMSEIVVLFGRFGAIGLAVLMLSVICLLIWLTYRLSVSFIPRIQKVVVWCRHLLYSQT